MIIDFHTHCFPDALAAKALPMLSKEAGDLPYFSDGTVAGLENSMKESGVDRSVMLQISVKPTQNKTVNNWAIERLETNPRIIPFGSVHPRSDDWHEELGRLAAAGVKGVKFHPEYQLTYVNDPLMFPIYDRIAELGLIVVFHAGIDVGVAPPVRSRPEHFAEIIERLPRNKTVLAHFGGWKLWDDVERLLACSHLFFDTSFCGAYMTREAMLAMVKKHGAEKFLMGSDSPWAPQAEAVEDVRGLELPAEDEAAILGGNAARLLGV
ncbi:MAG: amidohydrolase family protein [Kiritimatiellaeota bacterium]|nr:amidohydrolase family protein [Kiritimatiellota bacterium]